MTNEMVSDASWQDVSWRATLFGNEGELAYVQTVSDPPPSTISVPIMRRIRVVESGVEAHESTCGIRLFQLVWAARPRAEYKEV